MRKANDDPTQGAPRPPKPVMTLMTTRREAPQTARGYRRSLAAALAGVTLVAACEGENLFTGTSNEFSPQLQDLSMPAVINAGSALSIRVDASAARGVSQILLSLAGAVAKDTVVSMTEPQTRLTKVIDVPIPVIVSDTIILVQAAVVDELGDVSGTRDGTVVVFGPPAITALIAPPTVSSGELVSVRIQAFAARKISRIDLVTSGATQLDTTVFVSPSRANVTQDIVFLLPQGVQDTLLTLSVNAQDELGAVGPARTMTVPLAIGAPAVSTIVPASVEVGKVLTMLVSAASARHITELRVEMRGGAVKDTVVKLTPTRPNVIELIQVGVPANLIYPQLQVRVLAIDRANNVTATDYATVETPIGVPTVTAEPFASTLVAGHYADFRVNAASDRPITHIRFRWRGFIKDSVNVLGENDAESRSPETHYVPSPFRSPVIEDIAVETPCVLEDTQFLALVTAYDADNNLSPIAVVPIFLIGNPECDSTGVSPGAPRIRRQAPQGIFRSGGTLRGGTTTSRAPTTAAEQVAGVTGGVDRGRW